MKLVYTGSSGAISNSTGDWLITSAPALGFLYEGIFYDDHMEIYDKFVGVGRIALSEEERQLIKVFLINEVIPTIPPPTQAEIIAALGQEYRAQVQKVLQDGAMVALYDNIDSACNYAGAPNPFQAESQSFVTWRGEVWAFCYTQLALIEAGTIPIPVMADFIASLPKRTAP